MSQGVVTNYFAKKRRGGYIQPSKRLKLSTQTTPIDEITKETQPELIVQEIRQTRRQSTRSKTQTSGQNRRSVRNPKKDLKEVKLPSLDDFFSQNLDSQTSDDLSLRLSPTSSSSDVGEIITAANDDHDVPVTPSKRQRKDDDSSIQREKRSRVTPKKKGYGFEVQEDSPANTDFNQTKSKQKSARKILISQEETLPAITSQPKNKEPLEPVPEQKEVAIEKMTIKNGETENENEEITSPPARKTRSRKNATSNIVGKSDTLKKSKKLAEKLLAKKKDSSINLKEVLKSSNNLKDLQETLLKIRDQKKKQQEKNKKIQNKKIQPPQQEAAVAEKREFAYETLHSLAQEVPKGLPLPYKYKILAEMFRCADTVVGMLFNRQQITTWSKLQKSVKEMVRKNFELEHLSQIKSVFPAAFQYRQEKGIMSYSDHIRPSDYQLTVEPILDEREFAQFDSEERKLTSGMLVKRRHHFFVQLIDIVKEHHQKFLTTLDPPMDVAGKKILRWHPQFPLDRVPEVGTSDLPKPPNHEKERCHSAKDVLDKARSKFTKKAVDALKKVAERASLTPEKSRTAEENNNITPKKPATPVKCAPALKGVSQSLLAKIRAKEADKKLKSMVRSEHDSQKLQQLIKLPDVARGLRMLFVTEKKAALPLEYICDKLVKCCTGILTPGVVKEHVLLLIVHIPSWVNQTKVRNITYIRMDKAKEMSVIVNQIQGKIKEAEKI